MRMNDRADIGPSRVNVAMKTPFGGGQHIAFVRAIHTHRDDLRGLGVFVRDAGGRDQKAIVGARADVAGLALIDTERIHLQRGADDLGAQGFVGDVLDWRKDMAVELQMLDACI